MENDVKEEFEKLKKEIEKLKKDGTKKDRIIRQLSIELKTAVKRIKYLKESINRNTYSIDGLKNALRKFL